MKLRTIGVILIAGALMVVAAMQVSGHGLVTIRASTAQPQVTPGPQGTTLVVTQGPGILIHLRRIVPLVGVAGLGLLCFFVPSERTKGT